MEHVLPKVILYNTELNDLRKIICLRKTKVSVERISVHKVIENLVEMPDNVCHASLNFQ